MSDYYFTVQELSKMTKDDLEKLARYFEIEHKPKINRLLLINAIYEGQKRLFWQNTRKEEEPQMSVRIRRIKESNKGE